MALNTSDIKARIETDLPNSVLDRILKAAEKAVERAAGKATSATKDFSSALGALMLPMGRRVTSITSVVERRAHSSDPVTLSANDYRLVGAYRLYRAPGGDNSAAYWGSEVVVVFVPEVDQDVRDRVVLDLVACDVEFRPFEQEKSGDWEGKNDYAKRRRELLRQVREGRSLVS